MTMKKTLTFLFLIAFTLGVSAQVSLIDFESTTDDALWTVMANNPDSPDDMTIVANPDKSGINTSDSVLQFKVNATALAFVGAWSTHFGPIAFTADYHTLTMMVYKPNISNSGLKVEGSTNGGSNIELKVPNTVTNTWELLTFDFTAGVGYSYGTLVFFADFVENRTSGPTVYMDNITGTAPSSVRELSGPSIKVFPNPADEVMFIQCPDMTGFTITNMIGQTIRMEKFQTISSRSIELSDMPAGLYFLTVESGSRSYTSKFMVR
jgi:hypothetical protein